MAAGSSITALLGPTNTGKTHRAVERMVSHQNGIIGLPLRLLAREIYDRLTTTLGEGRVALVTGEEKRIPRAPSFWVCTVEAMPMDLEVDFLAVDEVQLAAHDQRGHVFTDRLLRARGRRETWFLGAETMKPLVTELVPTAGILSHPRLSRLSYAGPAKLSRLPPRSACIGFSTAQVYELAERLRRFRGGAAVVLGALSPRTRNAQVAMFQAGEVDYLVATDAIGMGLNLDVTHVAFASTRKFDGRDVRDLEPAELAQIAGRAGRYLHDGTFGTLAPLELSNGVASAIEAHRFPAVRRIRWRTADLDTTSIDNLMASLARKPPARCLERTQGADDAAALAHLAHDPTVRSLARGREQLELLWDVCGIPDYRKLLLETHVALLRELYVQLAGDGAIDEDWMARRVAEIDDPTGDVDTLTMRIAAIRTWTYVANQGRWVDRAAAWQERTRVIEDRLSDALHDALVQRFVERNARRSAAGSRRPTTNGARARAEGAGTQHSDVGDAVSHPFAALAALRDAMIRDPLHQGDPGCSGSSSLDEGWLEEAIRAPHDRFEVDGEGRIDLDGRTIGRLTRGSTLLLPDVRLTTDGEVGAGARARLHRRLVAFARDLVEVLFAPLRVLEKQALSAEGRGLIYQIEQGLGTALASGAADQIERLAGAERDAFRSAGVTFGARVLYVAALLGSEGLECRAALCAAWFGGPGARTRAGAPSIRFDPDQDPRACLAMGYPVFGSRAVRADVVERVATAIDAPLPNNRPRLGTLARWLGCPPREAALVVEALSPSTTISAP